MKLTGLSAEGKRLEIPGGLSVQLPHGAAYGTDNDGDLILYRFDPVPAGYRAGSFEVEDETPFAWKLSGLKERATLSVEESVPLNEVRGEAEKALRGIAENLTAGEESQEPYEPGSSTQVEETEDGFTIRSNLSISNAGGSYQLLPLEGDRTGMLVKKKFQLFGVTLTLTYLFAAVWVGRVVKIYLSTAAVPNAGEGFEELTGAFAPLLQTAELDPEQAKPLEEKPMQNAAEVLERLDLTQGERVEAGEFSVLVPKGLRFTREVNPDRRLLTCAPDDISFDEEGWDTRCGVAFTLQKGTPVPTSLTHPLDTPEGQSEADALLNSLNLSGIGQTVKNSQVGQLTTPVRASEYCISYELADDNPVEVIFRYFIVTHHFLYTGQYIGRKTGLDEDAPERHRAVLEGWLCAFQFVGGGEALSAAEGKEALGELAGADGHLDGLKGVALFFQDVLFFHDEHLVWDGKHHKTQQLQFNSAKMGEYASLLSNLDRLSQETLRLVGSMEENEALRIPAAKLGEELRTFLHGADLTGAVLFHLAGYHLFHFQETGENAYRILIDERIQRTVPEPVPYLTTFLVALRAYNGNSAPFTAGEGPVYRAIDVPDLFHDGGPALATDEDLEGPEEIDWEARERARLAAVPFDDGAEVKVAGSTFVLTGDFQYQKGSRDHITQEITARGGRVTGAISGKTTYLVIGSQGNFGQRKVEQVQEQRAKGKEIQIIREDALVQALKAKPAAKAAPAKPAPKSTASKPASKSPSTPKRSTSARSASKPASPESPVRIEHIQPEPGEFMRLQVTVDLPGLDDTPEDVRAAQRRAKKEDQDIQKQINNDRLKDINEKRKEADGKFQRAWKKLHDDYRKQYDELGQQRLEHQAALEAAQRTLGTLGFFQFSRKRDLRQQIAAFTTQLQALDQKLKQLVDEERKKIQELNHKLRGKVSKEAQDASYFVMLDTTGQEQDVLYHVLNNLSEHPLSRDEVMQRLTYSLGNNWTYSQLSRALHNPFIRTVTLELPTIRPDGTVGTEKVSGYGF